MRRAEHGFSLLELMIALAIAATVIAAASTFFIGVVKQYKVQTRITESNLEGVVGLELMRRDIESLGFGLPWNGTFGYTERAGTGIASLDALNESSNSPRAVISIVNAPPSVSLNQSDYLVIRSARVGRTDAAGKWTTLSSTGAKRTWGAADDDLVSTDYVAVLSPGTTAADRRSLVGTSTFSGTGALVPTDIFQTNIAYGIDNVPLKRPFNRADYYIAGNAAFPRPLQCAANTGVLVKAVIAHDDGGTPILLPLLDCVADLQVVYGIDNNSDGVINAWTDTVAGLTAEEVRERLVELHVHILAQQGKRDDSYTYPSASISVGSEGWTDNVDVSAYRNYRWKVFNIVVRPKNLVTRP